jgi:hypothetical protein
MNAPYIEISNYNHIVSGVFLMQNTTTLMSTAQTELPSPLLAPVQGTISLSYASVQNINPPICTGVLNLPQQQTGIPYLINNGYQHLNAYISANLSLNEEPTKEETNEYKKGRKILSKTVSALHDFGMNKDISVFIKGGTLEISHPSSKYKFVIHKIINSDLIKDSVRSLSSVPFKLELFTKTDIFIANLCVYADNTPILEQILALSLFIRTGDEDHIFERANFLNVSYNAPKILYDFIKEKPELINKFNKESINNVMILN